MKKIGVIAMVFLFSSPLWANPVPVYKAFELNWQMGFFELILIFSAFSIGVMVEYVIAVLFLKRKLVFDFQFFWVVLVINFFTYPVTLYFVYLLRNQFHRSIVLAEFFPLFAEAVLWYLCFILFQRTLQIKIKKSFLNAQILALLTNIGSFACSVIFLLV